jgi:endonuclease/exonuclease/phosphatase (EEP) superfamily protein YafD
LERRIPALSPRGTIRARRRSRPLSRLVYLVGWALVVFLGIAVLARLVAWDRYHLFAVLDAFTLFLYLPAWLVGVVGAIRKRWILATGALAVVIAQVLFLLPELTAATPLPPAARQAKTLRLFDANVHNGNPTMAGYIPQIRRFRPDLVTLENTSPHDIAQMKAAGVLRFLTHRIEVDNGGIRGTFIASRYPLGAAAVSSFLGNAFLVATTIDLPTGAIPLWVVHTEAPVNPDWHLWSDQLDLLDHLLIRERPRPLLMVGDFNSTWGNKIFRSILSTGLTDAAAARGDPFQMTWSQWWLFLPPLARIDHVITSSGVYVTSIHTGAGPGSDHRDLQVTVAVVSGPQLVGERGPLLCRLPAGRSVVHRSQVCHSERSGDAAQRTDQDVSPGEVLASN